MLVRLLIICIVLLIIIEIFSVCNFTNKKEFIRIQNIDIDNLDLDKNNIKFQSLDTNLELNNYIGKFYLKNNYGYFINIKKWNLLESGKLYNFTMPVNIKIIKLIETEPIQYYIDK
jgi:hypothetical protein